MRRRLLILSAALVLAVFSGVAVLAYAHSADRRALNGRQGVWVLLATETIPANTSGSEIRTKRLIRQVLMPAETVPSGALSKLDSSLDAKRLNAPLMPDQMLMRRQFEVIAVPSAKPTFQIPADRIAVSVALDVDTQVAGNVVGGSQVAVYCTTPIDPTADQTVRTFVMLPRVTVISSGESPLPSSSRTPAVAASPGASLVPTVVASELGTVGADLRRYIVTLAVTQDESEQLILGSHICHLHLGLLGPSASVSADPRFPQESEQPS